MTLTASDLGVLTDLATALGIVRDGSTDPSWFGDPAAHLGRVLADVAVSLASVVLRALDHSEKRISVLDQPGFILFQSLLIHRFPQLNNRIFNHPLRH